jgi:hypothetical protein
VHTEDIRLDFGAYLDLDSENSGINRIVSSHVDFARHLLGLRVSRYLAAAHIHAGSGGWL